MKHEMRLRLRNIHALHKNIFSFHLMHMELVVKESDKIDLVTDPSTCEAHKGPHGSILLINFYKIKDWNRPKRREKSEKDVQAITKFCSKRNYFLIKQPCCTKKDVLKAVVTYANDPRRMLERCCLIFLGSHGNEGYILDKNRNKIPIQHVVNTINKSRYLRYQYTVLVVEACRGTKKLSKKDFIEGTGELKVPRKVAGNKGIVIPHTMPKFYLLQSTQPGTSSKQGYFVPRLFKKLSKFASKTDVLSIFKDVILHMSRSKLCGGQTQVADLQCNNKENFFLCPSTVENTCDAESSQNVSSEFDSDYDSGIENHESDDG